MEVKLVLPDPKFKVGDFLHYTKRDGVKGFDYTVRVHAIEAKGSWEFSPSTSCCEGKPYVEVEEFIYYMTCQEGCLTTKGTPVRPGTFTMGDVEEMDEVAEKIEYNGNVWSPDTPDNIGERWEEWKSV